MSTDNIELLYGGSWRKDEVDFRKSVDNMVDDIDRLSKKASSINLKFNTGDKKSFKEGINEANSAFEQLLRTIEKVYKAQVQQAKATEAQSKADQQSYKTLREKNRMLRENLKEQERLNKALEREEAQLKKSQSAYDQYNKKYQETSKKALDLGIQIESLKESMQGVAAPGDTIRLNALQKEYDETSAAANKMNGVMKKLNEDIGKHNLNVGNYKSQWNGLNFSMQQMVREVPSTINNLSMLPLALSNNVGGLIDALDQAKKKNIELKAAGQATIPVWKQAAAAIFTWQTALMFGIALLVSYSSSAATTSKAVKGLAKAHEDYAETLKSTSKEYAETSIQLEAFKDSFEDMSTTMAEKEAMLETYNEKWGDQAGHLENVGQLEQWLVNKAPAFIQVLFLRAKATAALGAATELLTENLKDQANGGKDLVTGLDKAWNGLKNNLGKLVGIKPNTAADNAKTAMDKLDESTRDTGKSVEYLKDQYMQLSGEAAELSKKMGFDLDGKKNKKDPKGKEPTDLTNTIIEAERDINAALATMREGEIQADADRAKANSENEKLSLEDRLDNYEYFYQKQRELAQINYEKELEDLNLQQDKIIHKIDASNATEFDKEQARLKAREAYQRQIEALATKFDLAANDRIIEMDKAKRGIIEDGIKQQITTILQGAQDIENANRDVMNAELTRLNEEYRAKQISEKEYQQERKRIIKLANDQLVEEQKQYYIGTIAELLRAGKLTKEIADKLKKELAGLTTGDLSGTGGKKKTLGSILGIDEETINGLQQGLGMVTGYINDIENAISSMYDAQIAREEQRAEKQRENYEKELEYINSLSISDDERQKRTADLKAKFSLQELDQNRRIIDIKRRQARGDRVASMADAVGKGAVAILSAFELGPIAGAIAAIAIGALVGAQIAAISSQPLPEYYTGTESAKAGWAHVAERGPEIVQGNNGLELVEQPSIKLLQGGEKIYNAQETSEMLKNGALRSLAVSGEKVNEWVYFQHLAAAYDKGSKRIENAIKSNKSVTNVVIMDGTYYSKIMQH